MALIDYVTYQRQKAVRVGMAVIDPKTSKAVMPGTVEGFSMEQIDSIIGHVADAYGYLNGIDFEAVGDGEIPASSADRIFLALDELKSALEDMNIRINNYKIKG